MFAFDDLGDYIQKIDLTNPDWVSGLDDFSQQALDSLDQYSVDIQILEV